MKKTKQTETKIKIKNKIKPKFKKKLIKMTKEHNKITKN